MCGRAAQHSDCVQTLKTAPWAWITPCDLQTEKFQQGQQLWTQKFCHNETEIGRLCISYSSEWSISKDLPTADWSLIRWLRWCIKRSRKNFSRDFLAFFQRKIESPWLQNIHQKELFWTVIQLGSVQSAVLQALILFVLRYLGKILFWRDFCLLPSAMLKVQHRVRLSRRQTPSVLPTEGPFG